MDAYFNEKVREFKGKIISLTDDNYPLIVFPANVSTKINDTISLESILGFCRQERGNIPCLHILDEPTEPSKPQLMDIPKTHCELVRISFWKSSQWNTIKRHFKYALLISVIVGIIFFLCAGFSIIDTVITAISCYVCYYLFLVIPKLNSREMIPQEIPYSKEELEKLRNQEIERYHKEVEEYPQKIGDFTVYEDWYYHAINEREGIMKDYVDSFLAHILKSYFIKSEICEFIDDPPQKGRSEDLLFADLESSKPDSIHIDIKISGYYPDMMVSTNNYVYIDVEIDEPYEMESKKEIHYIGCGDEDRNKRIAQKEWMVIRFSEKQIMTDCKSCTNLINKMVEVIETGNIQSLDELINIRNSLKEKRWSKEDARMMAINNERNTYPGSTGIISNNTTKRNIKNTVANNNRNKKIDEDILDGLPF